MWCIVNFTIKLEFTRQYNSNEENYETPGEETDFESCPGALVLAERRNTKPFHGSLPISAFQTTRHRRLRLLDKFVDVLRRAEVRSLDALHSPFRTSLHRK